MTRAHTEAIPARNIVANAHFRVEPCGSCPLPGYLIVSPLPGYLIVSPRIRVSSLAELSPDAQKMLGRFLAAATRAIEVVVHPHRV
jgi:hypothetical protein